MKENIVVESLIEFYKEKGIDTYMLLDEPMFNKLPLDKKVSLIKQYASHISSSTPKVLSKKDIRSLVLNSLIMSGITVGSSIAGHAAFSAVSGVPSRVPTRYLLAAAGIGTLMGAGKTLLDAGRHLSHRRETNKILSKISDDGKDSDVIKLFALRNLHNGKVSPTSIASMVGSTVGGVSNAIPTISRSLGDIAGYEGAFNEFTKTDTGATYARDYAPRGMSVGGYINRQGKKYDAHLDGLESRKNSILEKLKGVL